ncbi:protein of unknown function DUF218 [Chthoniobacter flavus Ellin428]|uniref:DUF218 domain-containing protein n=1 Tax=Chthoniobacter flavus Ellin428 TaxID=497964 RepID=B4D6G7_9BACT|nr:YdcF family protein [Chthoniobacter flavus]EDY18076.1 protein of unknown function DUF218 [Chthoniobacter flavus Ellin428]TCO88317.1 DUF218 domain-containing protein [Chthoniobacter flavus]
MTKLSPAKRLFLSLVAVLGFLHLGTIVLVIAGLRDDLGHADVGLVLGSKVETNGTPSTRLRARLDRTLECYRAGYFPEIIVSGGIGKEGYDEAIVMRDYLVAHGLPGEHILLDNKGVTTFASARNTRDIAQQRNFHSVFVISQYFHLPRARLALHRFGFTTVYSAHAQYFELRDIYSAPRELFGYLSYCARPL